MSVGMLLGKMYGIHGGTSVGKCLANGRVLCVDGQQQQPENIVLVKELILVEKYREGV